MKLLYQMSSVHQHARLHQLADGRFQIVEEGELAPLMFGFGYVLVEKDFAQYLDDLYLDGVEIIDAIIYEPWEKQEIYTHRQLVIDRHFSSDTLRRVDRNSYPDVARDLELDGERFLVMDYQYVFVSPLLKERLETSPFTYLSFSEGLSGFVGG